MKRTLAVWSGGQRLGELATSDGRWQFRYMDGCLQDPSAWPLSPHFPLRALPFEDDADDRRVQWYFDNLLPEGGIRAALARHAGVTEGDGFGLLARFGEESAGALTLLAPGQIPAEDGEARPLTIDELRKMLAELPDIPLIAAHGQAKMSLAGAQHKLGVQWDGERFLLPVGGAASTHILKPDNARPERYPFCPANEYYCMQLARAVGLQTAETALLHLPEAIYLVERYDRQIEAGGVRRLHQIDLCQLLNKWPGYKYEAEGGVTFSEAFAAMDYLQQPAVGRERLLRWLVFNYLIGNSDAHAKNLAFLIDRSGIVPAPCYDLLSVKIYGDDHLAMSIGGEARYGHVNRDAWNRLANELKLPGRYVQRLIREMAARLPEAAGRLAQGGAFSEEEREFLEGIVGMIGEHCRWVME